MWRRVWKRIVRQQRERAGIVVQKFPDKMQRPRVFGGRRHCGEPDLPVDAGLIRRDEWRAPVRIARLGFEFVFLPLGVSRDQRVVCSLKENFVALAADCAECAVSVHQIEWIE